MEPFKTVAAGAGRTRVRAELFRIGEDVLAVLGGEGPHIGAASLAEYVRGDGPDVATLAARGHKEPELTERLAKAISTITGRRTLVVAGIHLDAIRKAEIEVIRANVVELIRLLDEAEPGGAGRS